MPRRVRSISPTSPTPTALNSTPNDGATAWIALNWAGPIGKIAKHCYPRHARRDLFEQLQPFRAEAKFVRGKTGGVPARSRQARDHAASDWVADHREHDGHGAGRLLQCLNAWGGRGQNDVRRERHQFRGIFSI